MAATQNSEFLFHLKRTIIDYHLDPSGATQIIDILGTYVDLRAAKDASLKALYSEGFLRDDFRKCEVNYGTRPYQWTHPDGVMVVAETLAGQKIEVSIDTTPNALRLEGNAIGEVEAYLHHGLYSLALGTRYLT